MATEIQKTIDKISTVSKLTDDVKRNLTLANSLHDRADDAK